MLLQGKKALIMGLANNRSIAYGIAAALKAQGARLAFNYVGDAIKKRVEPLSEELGGEFTFQCDVCDDAQIENAASVVKEQWGDLDILIHSVAFANRDDLTGRFIDTSRDGFNLALEVSAYSLTGLCRAFEPLFNENTLAAGLPEFAFRDELKLLWQLACACEGRRGKPSAVQGINDYNFTIEGNAADPANCRVEISERKRGSPLDKLVAELMIVANSTWGGLLAEKNVACLYRAQTQGKVRMTTSPLPHEGLGVPQYAWMTSPLRRYCDLVNQWQLIACLRGESPAFAQKSAELFGAMRDFEITYAAYADFQRLMERYWCLRWLQQHGISEIDATVRREQLVKLDHLPLMLRVPSLPADLAPGRRVRLAIESLDLLAPEVAGRFVALLDAPEVDMAGADEEDGAQ